MAEILKLTFDTPDGLQSARRLCIVEIFGYSLISSSFDEAADWLVALASKSSPEPTVVAHLNVNNLYQLENDRWVREVVRRYYHLFFDGVGLKLAYRFMNGEWIPDLNGTDLFPMVMERISAKRLSVFFLGGSEALMSHLVERSLQSFPTLPIAGVHSGYFSRTQEREVADYVSKSGAQLLLLSMGSSMQARFVMAHRKRMGVSAIWNVGGLFDVVSGAKPRAPLPVRSLRLEWLFRFALEPRRMWRRNLVAGPWLLARVLREKLAAAHN